MLRQNPRNKKNRFLEKVEHFSFVVQNNTARDPHTRLKTFKQFLAVFYDFYKAAISKYYGHYLPDFEIVVRQFLLIKIYTREDLYFPFNI